MQKMGSHDLIEKQMMRKYVVKIKSLIVSAFEKIKSFFTRQQTKIEEFAISGDDLISEQDRILAEFDILAKEMGISYTAERSEANGDRVNVVNSLSALLGSIVVAADSIGPATTTA